MKNRNLLTAIIIPFSLLFVLTFKANSQNIGINSTGATPNSSAMLDIDVSAMASKKGLLIPRITAAEKTAMNPLPAAAQGLLIYQTDGIQGFYYNTSSTTTPSWNYIYPSSGGWATAGNNGTVSGTNFIGTTDSQSLDFRTNNILRTRITTKGQIETFNSLFSVWIGDAAGSSITTGSNNTFIGYHAGTANTTGFNNTAIGCLSLQKCVTGTYNTGLGMYSLYNLTSGNYNVAIGDASGSSTNGSSNIFIGTAAGDNMTSGNANIIVGNYIDAPNSTGNNQLNIGNIIFGTSIDGSGTTLSTGNIGIGKNNPQYKFDVFKNSSTSHDRALNIEFNSNAPTTTAPLHSDSSAALFIRTRATSTGDAYSGYFITTSNSTGNSAGLLNFVSGTSSGTKLGIGEMIFGNGDKAGYTAHVSGSGNSHYGISLDISGASENYGLKAIVGSGVNSYGIYITGSPVYSAFLDQGVFYSKNNGYFGYTTGTYDLAYMLDVNGKANFTNALFFNGAAGTSGYILKSNGSGSAPTWTDPSLLGFYWDMDVNGDIYNNNSGGKVDVTGLDPKVILSSYTNYFRVKSNDLVDPLALQIGIKTDNNANNRYGAIEVDDGGTARDLILQPNSGNVGIGTISPATTLHVVGNSRITSLSGTGNRMVRTDANGTLIAYSAGTATQVLLGTGVWGNVPGGGNNWSVSGNSSTTAGTNFIGTTDPVDFVIKTNNTEWIRVLSGGNVGIGTNSPSYKIDVSGNGRITSTLTIGAYTLPATDGTSGQVLRTNGSGTLSWQTLAGLGTAWGLSGNAGTTAGTNYIGTTDANDLVFKTNSTEWMRILSGGNVGVGVVTPSQKLHVSGNIFAETGSYKVYNTTNDLYRGSAGKYGSAASYDFNNANTISGIVIENGETESGGFYTDGDMAGIWSPGDNDILKLWDEDGMILRARLDGNGNWYAVSNNATSDARLKKNIRPISGSLNKILALNGKVFDWKEEILFKGELESGKTIPYDELKNKIGFMAQDLELILPEVVSTNKSTGYKAVNYEAIIPVVTEAIKEQQKQIEDLKAIVAEQQKQIDQLKSH